MIDLSRLAELLSAPGIRIVLILLIGVLVFELIRLFGMRVISAVLKRTPNVITDRSDYEKLRRTRTLSRVFTHTLMVVAIIVIALLVLSELQISIAPFIAGAGIVGIAVGFGAQSLVKDFFAGIVILAEDQFAIGDVISIGQVTGKVEAFSLRRTIVRDEEGIQHHIPNGTINSIGNHTKAFSGVHFTVAVSVHEDFARVQTLINRTAKKMADMKAYADLVTSTPKATGVSSMDAKAMHVTVKGQTVPGKQWMIEQELQRRLLLAFKKNEVLMPGATPPPAQKKVARAKKDPTRA